MGFPILIRWHLYIESGPRQSWPHSGFGQYPSCLQWYQVAIFNTVSFALDIDNTNFSTKSILPVNQTESKPAFRNPHKNKFTLISTWARYKETNLYLVVSQIDPLQSHNLQPEGSRTKGVCPHKKILRNCILGWPDNFRDNFVHAARAKLCKNCS